MRRKRDILSTLCHSDCVIICVSIRIDGTFLSRLVEAGLENPAYPKLHGIVTQPHCQEGQARRSNPYFLDCFARLRLLAMTLICAAFVFSAFAEDELAQYASLIPEPQITPPINIPADMKITLDLHDIEITDALKFLAAKAKLNIIPTKKVAGRITLMVENTSINDVFDIMLRSNNLAYDKKGDIYNVMTEDEYKAIYGRRFSDIRMVKIIRLKYMVPEQAFTFLDTLKSEIGKILMDADSGTLLVMDTPENIRAIEEALSSMEEKSAIRIFNLKYARAKDMEEQLKKQLDAKKAGTVKADERSNQVIVQTLPERMEEIAKLIEGLDKKTKEILIDAKIIQVKLSNELSSGVEWEGLFNVGKQHGLEYLGTYPFSSVATSSDDWRSRQQVFTDTGYVGSYPFSGTISDTAADFSVSKPKVATDNMHVGVVGKQDFDLLIKYLTTLGETRILSNPKLAVVNSQEAKIHVGEKQAYITTTKTQSQSTTTTSEAVTFVDVGIQLFVTPFINDEGYVTIKVKPEISSVVDYLDTSSGNKIPIIDTSTAETMVMVKDASTIIIGGLSKQEEMLDSESTPILGKMPFFGNLFKTKTMTKKRVELLVMLTPHIIEGDELTTGHLRDFGHQMDKQFQDYGAFTDEKIEYQHKEYQVYPDLAEAKEESPTIKPRQELR